MLAADKLQLQSALKQQATALKEKEFQLHHSNLMTVGTQAAVVAALDVTMFIEFQPPEWKTMWFSEHELIWLPRFIHWVRRVVSWRGALTHCMSCCTALPTPYHPPNLLSRPATVLLHRDCLCFLLQCNGRLSHHSFGGARNLSFPTRAGREHDRRHRGAL